MSSPLGSNTKQSFDNHNYRMDGDRQLCGICGEVEPPLRVPSDNERTNRAAMHLVHSVRNHLRMVELGASTIAERDALAEKGRS